MLQGKKIGVVIPGAGSGSRVGRPLAKQFVEFEGKPIIAHTLQLFQLSPHIDCIAVAVDRKSLDTMKRLINSHGLSKVSSVVVGGDVRQESVWSGLQALENENLDVVLVHDAVRPFVSQELIAAVTEAALTEGAAIAAVRSKETTKISDGRMFVQATPLRDHIWTAQTPQAFSYRMLYDALEKAMIDKFHGTDDASLVERLGKRIKIVEGSYDNIKITTPEDLELAQLIARRVWTAI